MHWLNRLIYLFKKGGGQLRDIILGQSINKITDHPRVAIDPREIDRINDNFRVYTGKHKPIEYLNSNGRRVKRPFISLNMAKVVAGYIAGVVFNEQCSIYVDDLNGDKKEQTDSKANKFIQTVLNDNKFKKNFSKYLEVMFATGGLAVRPYVDGNRIEFSWCLADTFIPLQANTNNISECVISTVSTEASGKKTLYYTLLEFHEWQKNGDYTITHELYYSDNKDVIGKRIALTDYEPYADLQEVITLKGLSRPLFAYVKPYGFNNINPRSPLGLSVIDNAKPTLQQIDETYDAFRWEIKQGKRRFIVSDHFLRGEKDALGNVRTYFDDETDVFVGLPAGIDDMSKKDITSDLRTGQYIEAINKFLATLEMQTGLASGTFTFDGKSMKTATEVVSEKSDTYRTRNSHVTEIEEFLKELIISIFELGKASGLYTGNIPTYEQIGVDFDDGVFSDKNAELNFLGKASLNKFISKQDAIKRLFNLTDEQAKEWLQRINDEEYYTSVEFREKQALEEEYGAVE